MTTSGHARETVKFHPLQDRVLVQRTKSDAQVKGGLVLPESAKKKQETAQVIAVGPGKTDQNGKKVPVSVQIGQTILMDKYSGQDLTLNDEDFVVVRASDIIAIVEL